MSLFWNMVLERTLVLVEVGGMQATVTGTHSLETSICWV